MTASVIVISAIAMVMRFCVLGLTGVKAGAPCLKESLNSYSANAMLKPRMNMLVGNIMGESIVRRSIKIHSTIKITNISIRPLPAILNVLMFIIFSSNVRVQATAHGL